MTEIKFYVVMFETIDEYHNDHYKIMTPLMRYTDCVANIIQRYMCYCEMEGVMSLPSIIHDLETNNILYMLGNASDYVYFAIITDNDDSETLSDYFDDITNSDDDIINSDSDERELDEKLLLFDIEE